MEIIDDIPSVVRYPWDLWFDGNAYKLTHMIDFTTTPTKFALNARAVARRHGIRVKVMIRGDNVFIKAEEEGL